MKADIFDSQFQNRLISYGKRELGWGNLHIAMEDGNLEDSHLDACMAFAFEEGDADGLLLAYGLRQLPEEDREILYNRNY